MSCSITDQHQYTSPLWNRGVIMKTNYEQKITRQSDSTNSCEDELKNKKWQKTTTGSMFQSSYYACIFILFFFPFFFFIGNCLAKTCLVRVGTRKIIDVFLETGIFLLLKLKRYVVGNWMQCRLDINSTSRFRTHVFGFQSQNRKS